PRIAVTWTREPVAPTASRSRELCRGFVAIRCQLSRIIFHLSPQALLDKRFPHDGLSLSTSGCSTAAATDVAATDRCRIGRYPLWQGYGVPMLRAAIRLSGGSRCGMKKRAEDADGQLHAFGGRHQKARPQRHIRRMDAGHAKAGHSKQQSRAQ